MYWMEGVAEGVYVIHLGACNARCGKEGKRASRAVLEKAKECRPSEGIRGRSVSFQPLLVPLPSSVMLELCFFLLHLHHTNMVVIVTSWMHL